MWKPEYGDTFYYIDIYDGLVYRGVNYQYYYPYNEPCKLVLVGNCFKIREHAVEVLKLIENLLLEEIEGSVSKTRFHNSYLISPKMVKITQLGNENLIPVPSYIPVYNHEASAVNLLIKIGNIFEMCHYKFYGNEEGGWRLCGYLEYHNHSITCTWS